MMASTLQVVSVGVLYHRYGVYFGGVILLANDGVCAVHFTHVTTFDESLQQLEHTWLFETAIHHHVQDAGMFALESFEDQFLIFGEFVECVGELGFSLADGGNHCLVKSG